MQQLHGSGKTAVLVQRIINKIINEKIDIDKILVVTFTNAAASEMRGRILEAIYEKLEENPDDVHLQKQITLLPKASICTIHSFCLDVIKNNFYEIDVSANFRIGETSELEILKQDVIEEIFENKYTQNVENFLKLINTYTTHRSDDPLKELVFTIFNFIMSHPFPKKWLEEKCEMFNLKENLETDFSETIWGEILLNTFKSEIEDCIISLKTIKNMLGKETELEKFYRVVCFDIDKLETLKNIVSWDEMYNMLEFSFDRWPVDKKVTLELKDIAKEKRDKVKKAFTKIKDKYLIYTSKEANEDIFEMYEILNLLKDLVLEFKEKYAKKKLEKNIIDFHDIEHFALNILVKEENGEFIKTKVAEKYAKKFNEIAIDEYQDSNLVQEYILTTISNNNNIFMVGDVKQSIYRFRQARPELFIEKYEKYKLKEEKQEDDNLKIQLFKNFRSRKNILDVTNLVFESIMSKELGDINYNSNEYLYLGADYPEFENSNTAGKAELHILDLKENKDEEEEEEPQEPVENTVLEAKFVANKIKELLESDYMVYDRKQGYRKITYKDIVVLLRSTSAQAPIYEKEIFDLGLPVFSDTSESYLETIEIQTIMSVLKILDNPMQDIPMVTVLRSIIGNFTDNELVEIRLNERNKSFYESMLYTKDTIENSTLKNKIVKFLELIESFREKQEYLSLDELIWDIYSKTGYYNYVSLMPNGNLRQANLKMLFEKAKQYEEASFKGLFNFINFIDKLKVNSGDMGSAKLIGENENVIRIMSIHKSKGLEFPVVYLCGTSKKFNMQDLNTSLLLHQELGFGPKYINYERRIEYNTLAKEAAAEISKIETLSEEMRVLYVALTRAKEKLIITGISKDFDKSKKEKEELLRVYENEKKINKNIVKKYKSYLDWLELVYFNNIESVDKLIELHVHKKEHILPNKEEQEKERECIIERIKKENIQDEKKYKQILEQINWQYKNIASAKIPSKTSVTKLKNIDEDLDSIFDEKVLHAIKEKPKFITEKSKVTKARIGTLVHSCMQKLNFVNDNSSTIDSMLEDMVANELITKEEAELIDKNILYRFIQTNLYNRIKNAKKLEKEKPFYLQIKANKLYSEVRNEEDKILIQGIVDIFFIDKEDKLVLVDYKTDKVRENEQELVEKYKKQLELYKYAIEEATGNKVDEMYIFSTDLNKEIKI